MTTVRDIVTDALGRLNIFGLGDDLSSEEARAALTRLNDWLASLPTKDYAVTDSAGVAYTYPTLKLSDSWPLAEKFVFGMKAILAKMMADQWGYPVADQLRQDAREGHQAFANAFQTIPTLTMSKALPGRNPRW